MKGIDLHSIDPVLLLADSIDPIGGLEEQDNFRWVQAIANQKPVILLTALVHNEAILRTSLSNVEIVCLTGRFSESTVKDFHRNARHWISVQLQSGRRFSVAHHLTSNIYDHPSALIGFGIPFVVGSLSSLSSQFSRTKNCAQEIETGLNQLRKSQSNQRSLRQAAAVLCSDDRTAEALQSCGLNNLYKTRLFLQRVFPNMPCRSLAEGQINLIYDGRNGDCRYRCLIELLYRLRDLSDITLKILVSDEHTAHEWQMKTVNIMNRIEFCRHDENSSTNGIFQQSDLLIQFHEDVRLEMTEAALRNSCPILRVGGSGTFDQIDSSCGFVVSGSDSDSDYLAKISKTIRQVHERPFLLTPMRSGARKRASEINCWRFRCELVEKLYDSVIEQIDTCKMRDTVPA